MTRTAFSVVCFLSAGICCAGPGYEEAATAVDSVRALTGNIRVDFFGLSGGITESAPPQEVLPSTERTKSPWLAAGMSLLVPGSGEFYAESYWKAAAFFAVEVAAWTVAYVNNKKGDEQTESYQQYADQNWNVRQYAEWTVGHASQINPGIDMSLHQDVLFGDQGVDWTALNDLERDINRWYSHTLPPYGDQQYFELIGKYQQFYQGWSDAEPSLDTYEEISARLDAGGTQFTYYSGERGKANDYYSTASTGVTVAVINHIVSAIDAAWSASSYNSTIEAGVGFQKAPDGPLFVSVPSLMFSYRF
jgi:hypothetical protein